MTRLERAPVAPALFALLAAGILAAPASTQGRLWIVDAGSGCPLVDFPSIQQAIHAAADGDAILVRPGTYGKFTVANKSLALFADDSGAVSITDTGISALVTGMVPGGVVLRGFELRNVQVSDCTGPVWIEDCRVEGFPANPPFTPPPQPGALTVRDASSVAVLRGLIEGHGGSDGGAGQNALWIETADVHLYDSELEGGPGSPAFFTGGASGFTAGSGGSGIALIDGGFLHASECLVSGGQGGAGDGLFSCHNGGSGGRGLFVQGNGQEVHALETTLAGGPGGPGMFCPDGQPGVALDGPGLASLTLTGTPSGARSLSSAARVVPESGSIDLDFRGPAGDAAFAVWQLAQDHVFLPPFLGTLLPAQPLGLLSLGTVPATGQLSAGVPVPGGILGPMQALAVYLQGVGLGAGGAVLGSATAVLIVDASYDPFDGCTPP